MQITPDTSARATTITVSGAGGGAGASTLAAGLAVRAAAAGRRAVGVDLACHAGGLDVLLGVEAEPGLRWHDLTGADGEIDGERLAEQLPSRESLRVLSFGPGTCDVAEDLAVAVVRALQPVSDVVVIDSGSARARCPVPVDRDILVCRGTVHGVAVAGACTRRLSEMGRPPELVVRDAPRGAAADIADALGVPLLHELHSDRGLDTDTDRGRPPAHQSRCRLARACDRILAGAMTAADDLGLGA